MGEKVFMEKTKINKKLNDSIKSVHPWRLCPYGEHWVRTHEMRVPPSKTHPEGSVTIRHEHCALNPSGKDQLYPDEILEISQKNFSKVKIKPCSNDLGFKDKGKLYDDLISGWVEYWNDVLQPDVPLEPNLIKALIASESGFDPNLIADKKNSNSARGLMQILNISRKVLDGYKNDIKDHLISATKADLNSPNINICAGIRWLFEKKRLASHNLKKNASWEEAIWEYKSLKLLKTAEGKEKIKGIFMKYYKELQQCKQV